MKNPITGSQNGGEQDPPDPDKEEQDIGANMLLPPSLSTTTPYKAGGGGRDTEATNLASKAWTQLKLDNFMPLLGCAAAVQGIDYTG